MKGFEIYIQEDWETDKLNIYVRSGEDVHPQKVYNLGGSDIKGIDSATISNNRLVKETIREGFEPIAPFLSLPLRFGKAFLASLSDEITKRGINTREVDKEAGKADLMQQQLNFSQEQLVKFINHFTK